MFKKIMQALEPSKDKWFDLNDVKLIGACVLSLVGGWALVVLATIIF